MELDDDAIEVLVSFAREAAASGLLSSTCGNASVRAGDDRLVITASGASLGHLTKRDVAIVRLSDGAHLDGPRPSMETGFHRRVYRERPAARAVLHAQARAATALCCWAHPPDNLDLIPEVPAYVRRHAYAAWAMPGSEALADAVGLALADPDVTVVQLVNHGQVILGASPAEVLRRGHFFELACSIALSGQPLRTLPPADADALRAMTRV